MVIIDPIQPNKPSNPLNNRGHQDQSESNHSNGNPFHDLLMNELEEDDVMPEELKADIDMFLSLTPLTLQDLYMKVQRIKMPSLFSGKALNQQILYKGSDQILYEEQVENFGKVLFLIGFQYGSDSAIINLLDLWKLVNQKSRASKTLYSYISMLGQKKSYPLTVYDKIRDKTDVDAKKIIVTKTHELKQLIKSYLMRVSNNLQAESLLKKFQSL